jgi:hypothetical protein
MQKRLCAEEKETFFDNQAKESMLPASFYHRSVSTRLDFRKREFLDTFTKYVN